MQHGGCGAWHALCHGPVYVHGSCERAVCVKCGHVGREEVRGRKKWDVEPQSPNPCPSASRPRNARESVDCGDVREGTSNPKFPIPSERSERLGSERCSGTF